MAKSSTKARQTSEPPKEPAPSANLPVFRCRHRGLKAAVWQNETENGPFFNVTVCRSYKEGETWKESNSFGYDDVLIVAELLRTCHGFISREIAKQASEPKG